MATRKPMTLAGFRTLQKEHEHLTRVERPVVLQRIADAAAEGDRSENAADLPPPIRTDGESKSGDAI